MRNSFPILLALLATASAHAQTAPILTASQTSVKFMFPQGGALPKGQTLTLSSTSGPIPYSVAITNISGGGWLQVTPLNGTVTPTAPAVLDLQLTPFSGSTPAGVYQATITINQTLKIPATLTVTTSLNVSPASLAFSTQQISQQGSVTTPAPPTQPLMLTSAATIPFTATASSPANWLSVSPASGNVPITLTVSANTAGLAPGSYTGSLLIASPSAPTVTVPVTLAILPPLVFTVAPASLSFQSTSALPQPPAQTISVFTNTPSPVFASSSTVSGGNWLSVSPNTGNAPLVLSIAVNPTGLIPGIYTGQINVAPKQGATATPIPVTITVFPTQSPTLQIAPDTITLAVTQGGPPIQAALAISNTGGGTLNYVAQLASESANFLSIQSPSGSVAAGSPASIPFTATPGSLAPGTYTGTIAVGAGTQSASSPIVLAISPQAPSLQLSQTGVAFTGIAQATNPPTQTVSVANAGATALNWTAKAATLSGGNWLAVTPSSGSTQPLPAVPPTISISANTQNLAPGTYYGSVIVNSQVVSVQTTVLPASQITSPSLSTNGLVLTAVAAGANPAPQTVSILNPSAFSFTTSTDDGANWFTLTPSANNVSLQGNLTTLTPGVRHGTARLAFADGSTQTLSILSVVAPAGTASQSAYVPAASGGCPNVLAPLVASLSPGFSVNVTQSVPLAVTVVDDCGHPLANSSSSSVVASFYDPSKPLGPSAKVQPDVRLVPQGNGQWSATWTPQSATAQLEIVVVALGIAGTNPIAGQTTLTGSVRAAPANAPALAAGIFNAASFQPGNSVALGSFVSIFGANLANGSLTPSTQPLPTQIQGTQVFLGGVPLPLQYVGPNQINALIPANVAVDSQQPLVVQRDATQAAPTQVTIADSQPGIYTANQQGTGQAAVLTSDYSLDAPVGAYPGSHPATRGDYIQIFCTGLGAVTNPPAAGAAAPNTPLSYTVSTVTATIGGAPAPVTFAGLAPGFIGLYQVNATVPLFAPTGPAVPLILTVGTAVSNTATIALQ